MTAIKLLSKNKYLKVPLLYSGTGGNVQPWREHLQPCEWIQNDGNSYIILQNINGELLGNCEIEFQGYNTFGYRQHNPPGGSLFQIYSDSNNKLYLRWFVNNGTFIHVYNNDWVKLQLFPLERKINVNGNNYTIGGTPTYFTENLLLLGMNNITGLDYNNNSKLHKFKSNLFNLLSVYVIDEYTDNKANLCSAGVPGMVDVNTGVFYTNDGTGQFNHGNDIEI